MLGFIAVVAHAWCRDAYETDDDTEQKPQSVPDRILQRAIGSYCPAITEGAVLNGTLPGITTVVSSNGTAASRTDFIATATGRLGYTFGRLGEGMVYAKGGAAWARDRYQFNGQVLTSACGVVAIVPVPQCALVNSFVTPFNFGASETRVGWTVGAGVEWAVWENWSVKLEYDYLDFGSRTVTFNDPLLGAANISISQRISEVKLGVNYRFGSPLPRY